MKRVVACYFEPLYAPREADDRALIALWQKSWEAAGWETIVLGRKDIDWPEEALDRFRAHPTINGREYEFICFARHVAFRYSEATVFSDFDIINYGWNPPSTDFRFAAHVHSFCGKRPGLFTASKDGLDWLLGWMRSSAPGLIQDINGRKHCSDLTVFMGLPISFSADVVEYGDNCWTSAPLVHYGNATFGPDNRSERIIKAR